MHNQEETLVTEAEARNLWCPESRVAVHAGSGGATCNRHPEESVQDDQNCKASECMFWRWHDQRVRTQKPLARSKAKVRPERHETDDFGYLRTVPRVWLGKPQPDPRGEWEMDEDSSEWVLMPPPLPPRGYCGKAGHPLQAVLLDMQMELLGYQLNDERRKV